VLLLFFASIVVLFTLTLEFFFLYCLCVSCKYARALTSERIVALYSEYTIFTLALEYFFFWSIVFSFFLSDLGVLFLEYCFSFPGKQAVSGADAYLNNTHLNMACVPDVFLMCC
jgi:hypothetical protein